MARLLIIETATEALSTALFDDGRLVARHHEVAGRGHAEKLIPAIANMPDGGHATEIWVDRGPGSFTGVRIGIAAARGLAYAWGAQLRSYSSLPLVAAMAADNPAAAQKEIVVAMTGGHGELFWQRFDAGARSVLSPLTSTPTGELALLIDTPTIYGTGAQALVDARGFGTAVEIHPDASLTPLLPLSFVGNDPAPLYGRGADAKPAHTTGAPS